MARRTKKSAGDSVTTANLGFEAKLWADADALRNNMNAAEYIGYLAIAEVPVAVNQGFIAMKPRPGTSNLFLLRASANC